MKQIINKILAVIWVLTLAFSLAAPTLGESAPGPKTENDH